MAKPTTPYSSDWDLWSIPFNKIPRELMSSWVGQHFGKVGVGRKIDQTKTPEERRVLDLAANRQRNLRERKRQTLLAKKKKK